MKCLIIFMWLYFICLNFTVSNSKSTTKGAITQDTLNYLYSSGQYKEFSKLLKIDVTLVQPNKSSHQDDIITRKNEEEQGRQALNYLTNPKKKWDKGEVPYLIVNRSYKSVDDVHKIYRVIQKWNKEVPIVRFRKWKETDDHFVIFFNGNGCYSYVGKVGSPQSISLESPKCLKTGIILHEMMHTVGFTHEQNRPDRDEHIEMLWENIPEKWKSSYKKKDIQEFAILGPYDYYSIMHYPTNSPETNLPAYNILQSNVNLSRIGQRIDLTITDKNKVKALYEI